MSEYTILITKTAQKQLDKLAAPVADKLIQAIFELRTNPRPSGCKKVKGEECISNP